jgi:hypothetical protein
MVNKKALGIAVLSILKLIGVCIIGSFAVILLWNYPLYGSLIAMFVSLSFYGKAMYDIAVDEEERKAKRS